MKPKTIVRLGAIAVSVWAVANAAHAGAATGDATLPEQIIQEITLVEQLSNQIITAENSIKNLTSGFSGANALQPWQTSQITGQLKNLVNIIAQAQGVSYTAQNVAEQVKTTYGDPTQQLGDFQQKVAMWTANTNSQIAAALQQYGMNANDFLTTQQALNTIQQRSQSASGAMDLMQAGNQIGGLMVTQIQKLQSDIQAGNQLMANYIGQQANTQAHAGDALQNWLAGKSISSGTTTASGGTGSTNTSTGTGSSASTTGTGTVTASTGTTTGTDGCNEFGQYCGVDFSGIDFGP